MIIILLLISGLPNPATEVAAAAADITHSGINARFVRYLSFYNGGRTDESTVRFWINSLSTRRRFASPVVISPTLIRVDLRDFNWKAEAWEKLTEGDPYFRLPWISIKDETILREKSDSAGAILRADYFVVRTSVEPFYSQFLGLDDTIGEVKKKFGVREDDVKSLSLNLAGGVLESTVALHSRQLERWPTLSGYFWESRDTKTNVGRQNILGAGDNLFAVKFDASEYIWSLPNGLQAYYIADFNGKQLPAVDTAIASDNVTAFRDKTVRAGRSCVVCHAVGINNFDDLISRLIRNGKIRLTDINKERIQKLEDLYLVGINFKSDQAHYAESVLKVNGLTVQENAKQFEKFVYDYSEAKVTPEVAAKELGIENLEMIKASADGTLSALIAGEKVARDAWEESFPVAMKLIIGDKK